MTSTPRLKALLCAAAAVAVSSVAVPASGLLIMDPAAPATVPANNSAPSGAYAGFSYWNNMLGAHTYLGNGYLLTAAHVASPPTSITINGTAYDKIGEQRLVDPGDANVLSDLWVWKIGGANPLPSLPTVIPILSDPVAGEKTLIIGDGRSRAGGPTFWDITFNPGDNDDLWTVVANEGGADAKGFLAGTHQKQWGTNLVHDVDDDFAFNNTLTRGYTVNFSQLNATEFESQATNDDSSGPVFVERNGQWMLTGLMHVVGLFENQPSAPGYAGVYAYVSPSAPGVTQSNITGISDLSEYADQLIAFGVTVPEPTGLASGALLAAALLVRRRRGNAGRVE